MSSAVAASCSMMFAGSMDIASHSETTTGSTASDTKNLNNDLTSLRISLLFNLYQSVPIFLYVLKKKFSSGLLWSHLYLCVYILIKSKHIWERQNATWMVNLQDCETCIWKTAIQHVSPTTPAFGRTKKSVVKFLKKLLFPKTYQKVFRGLFCVVGQKGCWVCHGYSPGVWQQDN